MQIILKDKKLLLSIICLIICVGGIVFVIYRVFVPGKPIVDPINERMSISWETIVEKNIGSNSVQYYVIPFDPVFNGDFSYENDTFSVIQNESIDLESWLFRVTYQGGIEFRFGDDWFSVKDGECVVLKMDHYDEFLKELNRMFDEDIQNYGYIVDEKK